MQHRRSIILSLVFSVFFTACGDGPKIPVCIGDLPPQGFGCVDANGKAANMTGQRVSCTTTEGLRTLLEDLSFYKKELKRCQEKAQ